MKSASTSFETGAPPVITRRILGRTTLFSSQNFATPATNVPKGFLAARINVTFSHDGTRVLTLFEDKNHFSLWSVPEGQLLAVHRGDPERSDLAHRYVVKISRHRRLVSRERHSDLQCPYSLAQ